MTFDTKVPVRLKKTQQWFGSIISRPIDPENHMMSESPSGRPMVEEAGVYISPSPTLESHQRIELYNQQYWWRLMSALQESFPLLVRMFGYYAFNQEIVIPYLLKYPPSRWELAYLGEKLPQWIDEEYQGKDKKLVKDAVELDWAFNECFICKNCKPIEQGEISTEDDLTLKKIYLQPHLRPFAWDYDLFAYREAFLEQEPPYWVDHDFPSLPKGKKYYAVFRNRRNLMTWREIVPGEYYLLKQFERGSTISDACDSLENSEPEVFEEAQKHLQEWFRNFILRGWLTVEQ